MGRSQVRAQIHNSVMTITIDNPEMKNGLNYDGLRELTQFYRKIEENPAIRIGVVTAVGDYFYTGGRVDPNNDGEQELYSEAIRNCTEIMGKMTKPIIAILNGHCLKAGMSMLANADLAIAKKGIEFGFPEVRMGGVPMMVLVDTVDIIPSKKYTEALLTSWNFSDIEALEMGLVNCIVEEDDLWPTAQKYIDAILERPDEIIEMTLYAIKETRRINSRNKRFDFAFDYLSNDILPTMAKIKQEYNV